jgi:CRP-like cAMP-binding protein
LGQRLSPDLRTGILDKLTIRTLGARETIVPEGVPVPGILLLAAGKVDLVAEDESTTEVAAGQFVLPNEALSAGPSPVTARAGVGGALMFIADRKTTQELFATEPLLLELLAGG